MTWLTNTFEMYVIFFFLKSNMKAHKQAQVEMNNLLGLVYKDT